MVHSVFISLSLSHTPLTTLILGAAQCNQSSTASCCAVIQWRHSACFPIREPPTCSEVSWHAIEEQQQSTLCARVRTLSVLRYSPTWAGCANPPCTIQPNHRRKLLGEETDSPVCSASTNCGGHACVSVCALDTVCASVAWGTQWRTHVGLAQAVTHTHLALCASHTDRFVLAHSIQVVRPGGRGQNECSHVVCVRAPMCGCVSLPRRWWWW